MAGMEQWYVYIMSNHAHTLYTGITNDLPRRVAEHKNRKYPSAFTVRYTCDRLVYYEEVGDQRAAALREKRVKRWPRAKRVALIQKENPNWGDLSQRWDVAWWFR